MESPRRIEREPTCKDAKTHPQICLPVAWLTGFRPRLVEALSHSGSCFCFLACIPPETPLYKYMEQGRRLLQSPPLLLAWLLYSLASQDC